MFAWPEWSKVKWAIGNSKLGVCMATFSLYFLGTFAFHATLTSNSNITRGSAVPFNVVQLNEGSGWVTYISLTNYFLKTHTFYTKFLSSRAIVNVHAAGEHNFSDCCINRYHHHSSWWKWIHHLHFVQETFSFFLLNIFTHCSHCFRWILGFYFCCLRIQQFNRNIHCLHWWR